MKLTFWSFCPTKLNTTKNTQFSPNIVMFSRNAPIVFFENLELLLLCMSWSSNNPETCAPQLYRIVLCKNQVLHCHCQKPALSLWAQMEHLKFETSSLWVKLEKLRCQSAAFESAGQHSQPHINFLPFNKLAIHLTTLQLSAFTHLRCIMFNMYQISFKHYRKELTKVSRFFRGRYLGNKKSYWIS